jgi:hypothetical protein
MLSDSNGGIIKPAVITAIKPTRPTRSQAEFKRGIEFANQHSGKLLHSSIRRQITKIMEIRKSRPDYVPKIGLTRTRYV